MNIYINKYGDKFYCLNPIKSNCIYDYNSYYISCEKDRSKNLLHRIDGPAVEWADGVKYWFYMGKSHREDGPANEYENGDKEWYYHGQKIHCKNNEQFLKIIKMKAFL